MNKRITVKKLMVVILLLLLPALTRAQLSLGAGGALQIGGQPGVAVAPGAGDCTLQGAGYFVTTLTNNSAPTCAKVDYTTLLNLPTALPPTGVAGGDLGGSFPSPTVQKINGSQTLSGVQGTTGTKVLACTGSFTPGNGLITDINGNCIDSGAAPGGSLTAGVGVGIASGTVTNKGNTDTNFVTSLGADPTGVVDATTVLSSYLNGNSNLPLYVPCGTYKLASAVTISATASTGMNHRIYAASSDCATFNLYSGDGLWWNNTSTNADNNNGPSIEGIVFNDASNSGAGGAVHSAVRITQYANVGKMNFKVTNLNGAYYSTGTVTVTNGSTTVTMSGGTFPAAACPGGHLWVGNYYQELATCSGTTATLDVAWQATTTSNTAYSVDYNGVGLLLDGGSSFSQYNKDWLVVRATGARVGIQELGTSTSGQGISRFNFGPGYINCNRVTDSMAFSLGNSSDTNTIMSAANNCSRFVHMENSHGNLILGARFENDGAAAVATGCTGGSHIYSCNRGVESVGQATGNNARGNKIIGSYFYYTGVAISWDQYSTNFYVAGNDIETFSNDVPIQEPAYGTNGWNTATVSDPSQPFQSNGVVLIKPVALVIAGPGNTSFLASPNSCYQANGTAVGTDVTKFSVVSMPGLQAGMFVQAGYAGNPILTTGWGMNGGMTPKLWPDASIPGQLDFVVCNITSNNITVNPTTLTASAL